VQKITKHQIYYLKNSVGKKSSRNLIKKKTVTLTISNYTVFPIDQLGGRFLAILLEPQSKFGLHRFPELQLKFSKISEYPIIRI